MPFDIRIRNEVKGTRIPVMAMKTLLKRILKHLGWSQAALSVVFVDDRKIRRLNRRYLGHDRPTDVLAFSQLEGIRPKQGVSFLGDIVISLPTTRRQARIYGNSFMYELYFYLCHGILHLMGYDDRTRKDARKMERMQAEILEKFKI